MPPALKAVIAANVVSVNALALVVLIPGAGSVSGVFSPDEGHKIKLVPIHQSDERKVALLNKEFKWENTIDC